MTNAVLAMHIACAMNEINRYQASESELFEGINNYKFQLDNMDKIECWTDLMRVKAELKNSGYDYLTMQF